MCIAVFLSLYSALALPCSESFRSSSITFFVVVYEKIFLIHGTTIASIAIIRWHLIPHLQIYFRDKYGFVAI